MSDFFSAENNWHITLCISSRCTMCLFDIFTYCNMFLTNITLANISIMSHNYLFCVWWEQLRSSLLATLKFANFANNAVLLAKITMLYIGLYCKHLPNSSTSWITTILLFVFLSLAVLDSTFKWYHTVFVFLCVTYLMSLSMRSQSLSI